MCVAEKSSVLRHSQCQHIIERAMLLIRSSKGFSLDAGWLIFGGVAGGIVDQSTSRTQADQNVLVRTGINTRPPANSFKLLDAN